MNYLASVVEWLVSSLDDMDLLKHIFLNIITPLALKHVPATIVLSVSQGLGVAV